MAKEVKPWTNMSTTWQKEVTDLKGLLSPCPESDTRLITRVLHPSKEKIRQV